MRFGEYLKNEYGYNEPIYVDEISFKNYSKPWIFKELKRLVDSGEVKRFNTGIYYFPKKMFFGDSFLDPRKVVKRRFLSDGNEVYGYVSGVSLLNLVGISTQVPNLIELVSNNESTRVRDVKIGAQRVRVRRSRATVTKDNAAILQFLDLMNIITPDSMDETERFMFRKYVRGSGVTRDSVSQYAALFPAKALKNMVISGAAYELT